MQYGVSFFYVCKNVSLSQQCATNELMGIYILFLPLLMTLGECIS